MDLLDNNHFEVLFEAEGTDVNEERVVIGQAVSREQLAAILKILLEHPQEAIPLEADRKA